MAKKQYVSRTWLLINTAVLFSFCLDHDTETRVLLFIFALDRSQAASMSNAAIACLLLFVLMATTVIPAWNSSGLGCWNGKGVTRFNSLFWLDNDVAVHAILTADSRGPNLIIPTRWIKSFKLKPAAWLHLEYIYFPWFHRKTPWIIIYISLLNCRVRY